MELDTIKKYTVCDKCPCFDGEFGVCNLEYQILDVDNLHKDAFTLINEFWTVSDNCLLKKIEHGDKVYIPLKVSLNDIFTE